MAEYSGPSGEFLVLVTAIITTQLARGKDADELALLASFFTLLADGLAMIAVTRPSESGGTSDEPAGLTSAPVQAAEAAGIGD